MAYTGVGPDRHEHEHARGDERNRRGRDRIDTSVEGERGTIISAYAQERGMPRPPAKQKARTRSSATRRLIGGPDVLGLAYAP